jgi:hypothetical protein
MMRWTWIPSVAAAALVLFAGGREARAEISLAGDLDIGVPVAQGSPQTLSTGAGFDVRFGYRFRIPYRHISIVPELAAGYTDLGAHLVRVRPGLRVGIGRVLMPYLYGHVGWGFTSFDVHGHLLPTDPEVMRSSHGFSFDAGLGLDVAILRKLTVGAHLGYNVVNVGLTDLTTQAFRAKWMSFGLNATLYL